MAVWLWYIHTVDYYSTAKRNELLTHKTWMDLKEIMLNEKKKPFSEVYILYDSIYLIFLK